MKKYHDEAWLQDRYIKDHLSTHDMADLCGCAPGTIVYWLDKHDIPKRDNRKHHFNTEKFESIDTPSKAYWLGFLIADGNINRCEDRVTIILAQKDRSHLEKFRDFLEFEDSPYKIYSYHDSTVTLRVFSEDMVDDLSKYGVIPNKVKKTYLPEISDQYMNHLIHGIFDGDGSIGIRSNRYPFWCINGTKKLLQAIKKHIEGHISCSISNLQRDGTTYMIRKHSISGVKEILHYLYNDSTEKTRLSRKWKTTNQIYKLEYSY